jgi:galactokinase
LKTPLQRTIETGRKAYGPDWQPRVASTAPGRLELIGNHVDYNGGRVLAAAIDANIVAVDDDQSETPGIEIVFADNETAPPVRLDPGELQDWRSDTAPHESVDYVRGVIAAMQARVPGAVKRSARVALGGDVPIGFGISSSAALCVGLVGILSREKLDPLTSVLIAQEAEHRLGTPCGTMDQLASISGGVVIYNGSDNSVQRLSFYLGGYAFAVADSGVHRQLGVSSYPKRVAESNEALEIIRRQVMPDLKELAGLSRDDFDRLEPLLEMILTPVLLRRVRHVVTESARVAEGITAVSQRDWPRFGKLMTASGHSSATDYEISHPMVEELVAESLTSRAVLGARMMGGGEGGTALILLETDAVPSLIERLDRGYYARHKLGPAKDRVKIFGFAEGASVKRL